MAVALQTPVIFAVPSIPAPQVTPGPALFGRQVAQEPETCGFWSFSDREEPYSEYVCSGGCTTRWSEGLHGCKDSFATTCFNADDPYCSSDVSLLPGQLCCTQDQFSNCVTASKKDEGRWLVAYECWVGLSGQAFISVSATITEEVDGTMVTTEVTNVTGDVASGESKGTNSPAGSSTGTKAASSTAETSTGDASENSGGGKDSSGAPIGAIVGGVLGGVALILGIAFGLWFMRFYKRKHAQQPGAEPMREEQPDTSYYGGYGAHMPLAGTTQDGTPSVSSGYHDSTDPNNSYPMQSGAWGYQLPAEPKQQTPVEMPAANNTRSELQ